MATECDLNHSQYFYQASAYGLAGELDRPARQSIPTQAAAVLSTGGGRGSHRVKDYKLDGIVSFKEAYVEVGGSYDDCHGIYTTYAYSVLEGLNFADVFTADRVVSRLAVYSADADSETGEPSFDITGSHFENLKIAGHKIDVKLSTHEFHTHHTYSELQTAIHSGKAKSLLPWGALGDEQLGELQELEQKYHALDGISTLAKQWQTKTNPPKERQTYWCSAAGHLNLEAAIGKTELKNFGGIICIPKFGIIRLADLTISKHGRSLTMFTIKMCSAGSGTSDGGGTTGSGGRPLPPA